MNFMYIMVIILISLGSMLFIISFIDKRKWIFLLSAISIAFGIATFVTNFEYKQLNKNNQNNLEYVGAEVVDYQENNGNYVIQFLLVENEKYQGNIYIFKSAHKPTFDKPYLLTMDNKGTEEITDDEILVAWECLN